MTVRYEKSKRFFDVTISAVALVISLPLQAVISIMIAVKLGRPVLFRQVRPGLNGESFELVKFRSMKNPSVDDGPDSDERRMTPLGAKLRGTSLDELPTLWNVLRGDMSLVGPRPLLPIYLDRYTPLQARRHEVRPGITGLAQVTGRNRLDWEERFRLDVEYVDGRSWGMDVKILVKTIATVMRRDGIAAEGHVTMSEFRGLGDGRD